MDISLVTSLYRVQAFLAAYISNVTQVAAEFAAANLLLELVLVANDPSSAEIAQLRLLKRNLESSNTAHVVLFEVPRETLYASWNRGIRASSGYAIGNWNVDDARSAAALIEGHNLIRQGCSLVYFPFSAVRRCAILNMLRVERQSARKAPPFDRQRFSERMPGGSFALFSRDLYDRVGPFDENFRIAGDLEWYMRALEVTDFCPGAQNAGTFYLHGDNLSNTKNPLETVESNIINLRRGAWDRVVPCHPDLMRASWEAWGNQGIVLPDDMRLQLWGPQALDRWQAWLRDERARRRRARYAAALRTIPRFIINRTGLRPTFARWGLVKSSSSER